MPAELLEIQMLGAFQIRIGERIIPDDAWKLRKAGSIIKLLALEPTHSLHREQILDTLWPDLNAEAAANNLRYALHTARGVLAADGVLHRKGEYLILGCGDDIWVDVMAFEAAVDQAWRSENPAACQSAIDLYTGDLLPQDLYEEWLQGRRTTLKTSYLAILGRLARLYQESNDASAAIAAWQRVVATEPAQEEAHAHLMLLYGRNGQRGEALAQYDRLTASLASELGVEPDPVTKQLAQSIRDGRLTGPEPVVPAVTSRHNLPAMTTSFIGRERDMAEVQQALAESRLVTITGPGGVGKTRVALAVAEVAREHFNDGVFFVSLASLDQPELVETAIIHALGTQEEGGQTPVERLIEFLRGRSILLVIDNFEHLVSVAPVVTALLEACARLKVLATSRVALRLRGEREYPLRSLPVDASTDLFIQRSSAIKSDFAPSQQQMPTITEICLRLDGLPLAIELAASRSKILPPEALLARLEHPLALLTSGPRDLPTRQQTLRDTIAWSFDFLQPAEQALFRALAVFSGGWTLEAAGAVCPAEIDPMEGVATLVESSLIEQHEQVGTEPRFRMLQTIREFGLEQLAMAPDASVVREKHARYYCAFVELATSLMRGPEQIEWLERLEQEHANIRIALDWFTLHDVQTGLGMVGPLWQLWWMRGHLSIGRSHYETLLAHAAHIEVDPIPLAHALTGAGVMAEWQLDQERAIELQERALSIWLDCEFPPEGSYWPFISLGNMAMLRGEFETAESCYREGLMFSRRHGYAYGEMSATMSLGNVASIQGQFERAQELYSRNLQVARKLGDSWATSLNAGNLGDILLAIGEYQHARPLVEESMSLSRQLRHSRGIALAAHTLGVIVFHLGDVDEADRLFTESYEMAHSIGDIRGVAWAKLGFATIAHHRGHQGDAVRLFRECVCDGQTAGDSPVIASSVEGLAAVSHALGDPRNAARLYSCAATYREQLGMPPAVCEVTTIEQNLSAVRDLLPPEEFDLAWSEGAALTPGEI